MPSGPKKRRAARNKNVLVDVKIEPLPIEVLEPVAVKIEPVAFEPSVVSLVEPVAELPEPVVALVEPVAEPSVVGVAEPVADLSGPVASLVEPPPEPVVESSVVSLVEPVAELPEPVVGLVGPVAEPSVVGVAEPVADLSGPVASLVEPPPEPVVESSCEVEVIPIKESDQVLEENDDQKLPPIDDVEGHSHSINGEELSCVNELANSEEAMTEDNGVVHKCSVNGTRKLTTTKVELGEVKKSIQQQLRVVEQLTLNLRQILANLD